MAAAILRGVALGLLVLAVTLHVVGFVTNAWISAKMDKNDIQNTMSAANHMGGVQPDLVGLSFQMGLWKFCVHVKMGLGQSVPGVSGTTEVCQKPSAGAIPDWMKAVQALGILSMLTAALGVAFLVYGFLGNSKGDRVRMLPYIQGSITLLAGVLLLVGVVVYAAEYKVMQDQLSKMGSVDPTLRNVYQNIAKHISLGYSFALEAVAGMMMLLVTLVIAIPALRGISGGSPHNLAV